MHAPCIVHFIYCTKAFGIQADSHLRLDTSGSFSPLLHGEVVRFEAPHGMTRYPVENHHGFTVLIHRLKAHKLLIMKLKSNKIPPITLLFRKMPVFVPLI